MLHIVSHLNFKLVSPPENCYSFVPTRPKLPLNHATPKSIRADYRPLSKTALSLTGSGLRIIKLKSSSLPHYLRRRTHESDIILWYYFHFFITIVRRIKSISIVTSFCREISCKAGCHARMFSNILNSGTGGSITIYNTHYLVFLRKNMPVT